MPEAFNAGDEPKIRTRVDKPVRERRDGAQIRTFSDKEDAMILAWVADCAMQGSISMYELARDMGRKRHSVAARIKTLQKHGKIAADWVPPDGRFGAKDKRE